MVGLDRVKETRIMKDLNIPINQRCYQETKVLEISGLYNICVTEIEEQLNSSKNI